MYSDIPCLINILIVRANVSKLLNKSLLYQTKVLHDGAVKAIGDILLRIILLLRTVHFNISEECLSNHNLFEHRHLTSRDKVFPPPKVTFKYLIFKCKQDNVSSYQNNCLICWYRECRQYIYIYILFSPIYLHLFAIWWNLKYSNITSRENCFAAFQSS